MNEQVRKAYDEVGLVGVEPIQYERSVVSGGVYFAAYVPVEGGRLVVCYYPDDGARFTILAQDSREVTLWQTEFGSGVPRHLVAQFIASARAV